MRQSIRFWVVGLVGFAPLGSFQPAAIADGIPQLFHSETQSARMPAQADPTVMRSRVMRVNVGLLDTIKSNDRFELNLFEDETVVANIQIIKNRSTWVGTIQGEEAGSFTLINNDGVLSAIVRVANMGIYRVRSLRDGVVVIQEIDETRFPPCGIGPQHGVVGAQGAPAGGECDDGSVIDVLVIYTALARSAAGGTAAIEAEIDLAIANTNTAYNNSLIGTQLNLVHVEEIPYDEVGGYVDHLYRLTDPADGDMDTVHDLREQYGADMVALLVDDGQYCGVAWLMGNLSAAFEEYAFSVTTWYCAAGNLTFAHELGHNQGCQHNRANAGSDPVFDYSYGYQDPGELFRTVMSYNCPGSCPRIQHLSNPDVTYQGLPTGVAINQPDSAHNALSINQTALTVANFRCSNGGAVGPVDFSAFRGFYDSGDLNSLLDSDDDKLCYNPGIVLNLTEAPVTLDFEGTLPNDSPSTLEVTIESSADTVGLELRISFWNFNTDSWDVVGTATQSLDADTVRTFTGTPADHVEAGTGAVRTRYEVRQTGPVFLFPWLDRVDHVYWTISN